MDKPIVKIILFVVFVIVAQIIAAYKKSQAEAARRRAEMGNPPLRRPTTQRPRPVDEEEEYAEEEYEPEIEPELPPAFTPPPRIAPALPTRVAVEFSPTHTIVHATTPLPPPPPRRSAVRLDRRRVREAIVMMEVMGPPVALRDR